MTKTFDVRHFIHGWWKIPVQSCQPATKTTSPQSHFLFPLNQNTLWYVGIVVDYISINGDITGLKIMG
jgi:hypothetical protein